MTHINTPQGECQFGIARGDITPPVGIYCRMWGAARHDCATGVHRPLLATAVVFRPIEASAEELVLVALDHCLLVAGEMKTLRECIVEATGIDDKSLVVVFSHTHAAGWMSHDRVDLPGGEMIPPYLEQMNQTVSQLVKEARESVQPATITYGEGVCDLAAHRDHWDEANQVFVCGYNPGVPADQTVLTARFSHAGETIATLVNYACHPTTLAWENTLISPDYPGAMREVIEQATSGAPCVFLQGASGELGPVEGFVGDTAVADRNGRQLGYAALSSLAALPPAQTRFEYVGPVVSGATLGEWKHVPLTPDEHTSAAAFAAQRIELELDYRSDIPTKEETLALREQWLSDEQRAQDQADEQKAGDCRAMVERCNRRLARFAVLPAGDKFPYIANLWRIGNGFWVAVEGEPYNALQQQLRERFPETPIVVCSLNDGSRASYLPTQDIYDKPIYQQTVAILAPGSLEKVIEKVGDAIAAMQ